jgi:hypothetical protein
MAFGTQFKPHSSATNYKQSLSFICAILSRDADCYPIFTFAEGLTDLLVFQKDNNSLFY